LDQWVTDIESAKHHLEAMSDQKRYVVLGVRFSAGLLLGARVARPWSRMVLWDPILDGNAWIRAQREMRVSVQASYADDPADLSGERASEALLQSAATFKAPVAMADEVHVIRTHSSSQGRPEWRYTDVDYDCRWGCATLNNLFAHTVVRSIATVMML
jgi:hypothetical protein